MTAIPFPRDTSGSALKTFVDGRTTQMNTLAAGSFARAFATQQLDADQQALVVHLMAVGRLKASDILSTMT